MTALRESEDQIAAATEQGEAITESAAKNAAIIRGDQLPTALQPSIEIMVAKAVDAQMRQLVSEQTRMSYLAYGVVVGVLVAVVIFALAVWLASL